MAQLADEAIVISRGRLVRQAPIARAHERLAPSFVVVTPEVGRLEAALRERGPRGRDERGTASCT